MGGVNEMKHGGVHSYQHGGAHNNNSGPDIKIMAKDSYRTADDPQPGRDFIYMVDGQPTDFSHADIANLLRAEGISGNNLNIRMNEIFYSASLKRWKRRRGKSFQRKTDG